MEDLATVLAVEILRKVQDVEVPSNPDRSRSQSASRFQAEIRKYL